jgi:TolB protein
MFNGTLVVLASAIGIGIRGEGQIAFVSDRASPSGQIFMVDVQRGLVVNLTPAMTHTVEPDWSPDGRQLLLYKQFESTSDLLIMDANGRNLRALSDGKGYIRASWSPDSTRIVIEAVGEQGLTRQMLFSILHLGSGEVRDLPAHNPRDMSADWSPDGQQIVFQSSREGNFNLYLMDSHGNNERRLTHNPANDFLAAWSPDGQQVAFVSDRDDNYEIYTLDVNTLEVRRLTHHESFDSSPAWSPDGRHIAFASNRDGNYELYTMEADGSHVRRLTHYRGDDLMPSWWP